MKNKKIVISIIAVSLILFSLVVYRLMQGTLEIKTSYNQGSYYLDTKEINPDTKKILLPGTYALTVKIPDLEEKTYEFKITPLKTTTVPIGDLKDAYLDIDEGYIKPEMQSRYNIIQKTPLSTAFGTVDHDKLNDKFIVILKNGHTKQEALDWFSANKVPLDTNAVDWR